MAWLLVAFLLATPGTAGLWHDDGTLEHDGLTRRFRYYTPDHLPANHPLVFVLHGGGGDMHGVMNRGAMAEWPTIADDEGILLIVPNGVNPDDRDPAGDNQAWNDCRGDAVIRSSQEDDVGFIDALIDWAGAHFAIEPRRIYATGASNGGMMSYRLAFELGHRVAGIAAFIANRPAVDECSVPVHPTPVFICNGDAEANYMPWEGGCVVANSGCERGTVISALATRDFWIGFNRCDPEPVETIDYPDLNPGDGCTVTSDLFTGGIQGTEVMFYRVRDGGHTTPTILHPHNPLWLQLLGLGNQNRDIEGAREAWAFLARHTLTGPEPASPDPGVSLYLRIEKWAGATLRLAWSEDCGAGTTYGVYRGDLRSGYASLLAEPGACAVAETGVTVTPGPGPADFFLAVPNTGLTEGSYGPDATGADRPPADVPCLPREALDPCVHLP
jgi:polyhydroxybutyrate depolymerase